MKVLTHVFYTAILCLAVNTFGQGEFKFDEIVHDFGVISEGTQAQFEFTFTNAGDTPIEMSNVRASCGCTTPFYTKEPVMPGETGSIKVNYNSSGRMGAFVKSITITSNAKNSNSIVFIKGVVEKRAEVKEYTKAELAKSPIISVEKKEILIGTIEKGKKAKGSFVLSNKGKSDLVINKMAMGCNCVQVQDLNRTIKPGESATFTFDYSPSNLGEIKEKMTIYSNDLKTDKLELTLISQIKETLAPVNMMQNNSSTGF